MLLWDLTVYRADEILVLAFCCFLGSFSVRERDTVDCDNHQTLGRESKGDGQFDGFPFRDIGKFQAFWDGYDHKGKGIRDPV